MQIKNKYLSQFLVVISFLIINSFKLQAQLNLDSVPSLTRFKSGNDTSYKIPMTKFYFVNEVGLSKDYSTGWIMKWDVIKKANSSLLFMEMNGTDAGGWIDNEDVNGSVQLVCEIPKFSDSIYLKEITNTSKGLHIVNNYSGSSASKKDIDGEIKINKVNGNIYISSSINLITDKPKTKQQFYFINKQVQDISFDEYQIIENTKDSLQESEINEILNDLEKAAIERHSIWEIENLRIKDSLRLNPYQGKFRFWVSDVNKAENSRNTYSISNDSLIIKEGPYDFIYLAKNYSHDSVFYKKALTEKEKIILADIEKIIATDSLEESYNNFCIIDGSIISFSFESAKISKDVTVSNSYNLTIASVVEFINTISPNRYKLWYDKKTLLKQQNDCDNRSKN